MYGSNQTCKHIFIIKSSSGALAPASSSSSPRSLGSGGAAHGPAGSHEEHGTTGIREDRSMRIYDSSTITNCCPTADYSHTDTHGNSRP